MRYCHLHEPSLAQQIYCDKILFSHTRRWYQSLFLSLFIFRFYVILLLLKIYVYIFYSIFFFHETFFYFFMFRGVPECSVFLVLLTPDSNAANY